jgi:hypothetical protein
MTTAAATPTTIQYDVLYPPPPDDPPPEPPPPYWAINISRLEITSPHLAQSWGATFIYYG